jgi:SAM-dependent methyltransferase
VRLDDPELVRAEYADEERLLARRVVFRDYLEGPNAEDIALEAVRAALPRHVLEVGCGPGYFAERVRDEVGAELVALDSSRRMVELARRRGLAVCVGDVQALPFPDGAFDVVIANWMLYHVPNLDRALAEIGRVLRSGGVLVAATFGPDHLRELWALIGGDVSDVVAAFDRETGAGKLRRLFARVDRRDADAVVVFPDREAIRSYVSATIRGAHLADRVPELDGPYRARSSQSVFVAETST